MLENYRKEMDRIANGELRSDQASLEPEPAESVAAAMDEPAASAAEPASPLLSPPRKDAADEYQEEYQALKDEFPPPDDEPDIFS
jgi:hypothetical protein